MREFDELVSRRRAQLSTTDPYDLLMGSSRGTPPPIQSASSGQRYKDLPFNDRFGGPYPPLQRDPELIKRRFQEELLIDRLKKDYESPNILPQMIYPGHKERFGDSSKVISELRLPPSLGKPSQPVRTPLPPQYAPSQQSIDEMAAGAGTLPMPPALDYIQRAQEERNRAQGIVPGRARGGEVEKDKPYRVGEFGEEIYIPDKPIRLAQVAIPEGYELYQPKGGRTGGAQLPQIPEGYEPITAPQEHVNPDNPRYNTGVLRSQDPGFLQPAPTAGQGNEQPPPIPADMAGVSQFSADPAEQAREVAARRMMLSVQPPGGREEGAATRMIEGTVPAIVQQAGEAAQKAMQDPNPENVIDALTKTYPGPRAVAGGTGRAVAQAFRPALEAQQLETGVMSIPRAATGGPMAQAFGRGAAAAPVGGTALREASQAATAELRAAGEAAAARPTGQSIAQETAGGHVKRAIMGADEITQKRFNAMLQGSNEDVIGDIIRMAGTKQGADIKGLGALRGVVAPTGKTSEVQSAIIDRLGRGPQGEWNPKTWADAYGGLSNSGKTVLFGQADNPLRYHLDSILGVSKRAPSWEQFDKKRSILGGSIGAGALAGAALTAGYTSEGWQAPLAVLSTVVPLGIIARSLARPALAAPLANYAKAYERFARSGASPAAIAGFKMAVDNLSNAYGMDFSWTDLIQGMGEPVKAAMDKASEAGSAINRQTGIGSFAERGAEMAIDAAGRVLPTLGANTEREFGPKGIAGKAGRALDDYYLREILPRLRGEQ